MSRSESRNSGIRKIILEQGLQHILRFPVIMEWIFHANQRAYRQRGLVHLAVELHGDNLKMIGPTWKSENDLKQINAEETAPEIVSTIQTYDLTKQIVILITAYDCLDGKAPVFKQEWSSMKLLDAETLYKSSTPPISPIEKSISSPLSPSYYVERDQTPPITV